MDASAVLIVALITRLYKITKSIVKAAIYACIGKEIFFAIRLVD